MPSRARLLAEYFTNIVVDATTNIDDEPSPLPPASATTSL
jgi:hypothetical protein